MQHENLYGAAHQNEPQQQVTVFRSQNRGGDQFAGTHDGGSGDQAGPEVAQDIAQTSRWGCNVLGVEAIRILKLLLFGRGTHWASFE